jgi:asparaginyl-tRNA synthetase
LSDGKISTGASVVIEGTVVLSPGGKQKVEVKASSIQLIGAADAATFPLQKKKTSLEFLRGIGTGLSH